MAKRFRQRVTKQKGSKETFFEDASAIARRSALPVESMTAEASGAVSIVQSTYSEETDQLSYQVSYDRPGTGTVKVTIVLGGTGETIVYVDLHRTLDSVAEVVGYA